MDDYAWAILVARFIPFLVWSFVIAIAPARLQGSPDEWRQLLMMRLVWGASAALFVGGLAFATVIPGALAVLFYTVFGAVVSIVGVTFLWIYGSDR